MKDLTKLYLIQAEWGRPDSTMFYYIGEHSADEKYKDREWYRHTFMEKFYERDIDDKFEYFYTFEEATRILKKYHRYGNKPGHWYNASKVYLTRASKLKNQFKKA